MESTNAGVAALGDLLSTVQEYQTPAFALATGVLAITIGIKLYKKFANRAS